jgi:Family of unknown function (DUF6529)
METASTRSAPPTKLIGIALLGAAVSVAIGVYGNEHTPTGKSILGDGLFFSGTLNMKAWLATAVVVLALFQLFTALRMFERIPIPRQMPGWFPTAHRVSGTLAFLISLPVAYHCLWALGFQFDDAPARVAAHSLLGCFFYGAFTTKMLLLKVDGLPYATLPIIGGLVFSSVIAIWLTSSLWFFENIGFPQF